MEIKEVPVDKLKIDKFNVRGGEWDEDEELTESIKQQGVLEPLLVRTSDDKKKAYSVICGSRRWHAAIDAGLKKVPCVVRNLTDVQALGTSLQENLQRGNLDKVQESEAIAKMWDLLDGDRTYEQRMGEMNKQFGLSRQSIDKYLAIAKQSGILKKYLKKPMLAGEREKLDIDTAAGIANKTDWNKSEKAEAAKILSRIESTEKRRKVLSKMKDYADLTPKKAYEKVKRVREDRQYNYSLPASLIERFDEACSKSRMGWSEIITEAVKDWLKKKGY